MANIREGSVVLHRWCAVFSHDYPDPFMGQNCIGEQIFEDLIN